MRLTFSQTLLLCRCTLRCVIVRGRWVFGGYDLAIDGCDHAGIGGFRAHRIGSKSAGGCGVGHRGFSPFWVFPRHFEIVLVVH